MGRFGASLLDQTIDVEIVGTPGGQHCSTGATHRGVGEQRAQMIGSPGKRPELYRLHPPGTDATGIVCQETIQLLKVDLV